MSTNANPATAGLSRTQRAALLAAKVHEDGTPHLYRGGLNLEYACVPASTLRALHDRGLAELKTARVERRSRAGLVYRGTWTVLDHAVLTEAGCAARAELLTAQQ